MTFLVWVVAGLQTIDERFLDTAQQWASPDPARVPVTIVDVDDATSQALGYPFSRAVFAKLLDVLERGGARWVVFDFVFDTRRRSDDGSPLYPGEDSVFAASLARHPNTTLAGQIPSIEVGQAGARMTTVDSRATISPLPEFQAPLRPWGVVQSKSDADGIVRRYRSWWSDLEGRPRLALATRALVDIGLADSSQFLEHSPWNSPSGFRVRFFGGPRTFPTHSLLMAVDDSSFQTPSEQEWDEPLNLADSLVKRGAFRGRVVLVGSSAMLNQDLIQVPGIDSRNFPGVELHAHAMGTWLLRVSLQDLPPWIVWITLLVMGGAALAWSRQIESWWILPLPGLLMGGTWSLAVAGMATWGGWAASMTQGVLGSFFCLLFSALERYVGELARKREVTRTFGKYVSPEVVKLMIEDPTRVHLGGQRGEITLLFSDFEGFTRLSEQLPPEQFVPQIGDCFTALSSQILEQLGTLDKYMGDAIMAEFGIPLPLPDKELRACRAAWRMQEELARLRALWSRQGLPGLHMRVGVSTGDAIYGNMGSRQLFDYTALGDCVNLGSRLEGVNKVYGTRILLDGTTRRKAGTAVRARMLDRIRVVGKSTAVEVWELLHVEGEPGTARLSDEVISLWEQLRARWDACEFRPALALAQEILERVPEDGPTNILALRLAGMVDRPPPPSWDGSVTLDHK
ncbi:MAG: adenylate/guanylate cyclase domain-containing protein [Fibrobacteria bacterium]|nr:adenylate/guanylate cyclase domain-containing protein [Fibrobacteria bacterium]